MQNLNRIHFTHTKNLFWNFFIHVSSDGEQNAATIGYFHTFTTNLPDYEIPERPSIYYTRAPVTSTSTTRRTTQTTTFRTVAYTTPRTTSTTTRQTTTTEEETPYQNKDMLDSVCGVADYNKPTSGGLIRGGSNVMRGQFPWMAAYFYTERYSTGFICGGSLISSSLVVTAAHCIEGIEKESVKRKAELSTFYIGKNNLESLISETDYVLGQASELHVHPSWKKGSNNYDNDIAIAVLIQSVVFNKFVKPLCIWRETNSYEDLINKQGKVAGWGKNDESAISSVTAKFVSIPVVSNEKCLKSNAIIQTLLGDNAFCGGVLNSDMGPCNGEHFYQSEYYFMFDLF